MDFRDSIEAWVPINARSLFGLDVTRRRLPGPLDLTIIFTDIDDYTSVIDRFGDETAQELVREHNRVVRTALDRFGGIEVKHTGDGIMAYFGSASRAVASAVEIQREVAAYNAESPAIPLSLAVGINSGTPIEEEGDLFGTPVVVAARVVDLAEGGEILATDVVRQLAVGHGFEFESLGNTPLDGIRESVELFRVCV